VTGQMACRRDEPIEVPVGSTVTIRSIYDAHLPKCVSGREREREGEGEGAVSATSDTPTRNECSRCCFCAALVGMTWTGFTHRKTESSTLIPA
jgi:hypothetical protein